MHEVIVNLHMHTRYSDGFGTHQDIADAAMKAGLDAVIVTDHNVYVIGPESYYQKNDRKVLLLVGEEVHDQARDPQKDHLLVIGAGKEMAHLAHDPQTLLDSVRRAGGLAFIAHPVDPAAPAVGEGDISWVSWHLNGYTGIELWNGLSEFKSLLKSKLHAVYYAYNPQRVAKGPFPETLKRWDELLAQGKRIAAVGGSDAHALDVRMGPLRRILFPYEFHFRAINTHLILPGPLTGDVTEDRRMILEAMSRGRGFVGYDLPASTRGFRFIAKGRGDTVGMGEEVSAKSGVTMQIRLPAPAGCRLVRNGRVVKTWTGRDMLTYITSDPGAYRVEAYLPFMGQTRGWIFSNPIYVI
jgi:hypothetical protein